MNAENFAEELLRLSKISSNLFDSNGGTPFAALVSFAKKEPETVRNMFIDLYSEDNQNLKARQEKIDLFIEKSEELRMKYKPDSHLYKNDQRSAMQFLFLRFPNENYAYKATQAKSFADSIAFYDDWGPMSNFKIDVYYRMCDWLVQEIKEYPQLIETTKSRFEITDKPMHPDDNLHILAFDIIYCSQVYDFYVGMKYDPITAKSRKLYEERINKARELLTEYEEAEKRLNCLNEAMSYVYSKFAVGTVIKHKIFGEGTINDICGDTATVEFIKSGQSKKLLIITLLINNSIIIDNNEVKAKIETYKEYLKKEKDIPRSFDTAKEKLAPYKEYLE